MEDLSKVPTLYHYTSQAGLLGMQRFKKLWFSHINYLNDSQEFYYSLDRIEQAILELYGQKIFDDLKEFIPKRDKIYPVFVFSLSERKDSLSQWRGYCPNGGYSVSFDPDFLHQLITVDNLVIARCRYEEGEQMDFIKKFIFEEIIKVYVREKDERGENRKWHLKKGVLPYPLISNILKFAPFIKHPKFKDEKEWRMVDNNYFLFPVPDLRDPSTQYQIAENKSYLSNLKFREGKSGIVPYLELGRINSEKNQNIFSEIFIGPTPNKELSIKACRMLVQNDSLNISASEIPYRNW